MYPLSLSHYEGRPEPHDRVSGWEIMHMWVNSRTSLITCYFTNTLSCNKHSWQWETTINLLCTNKEERHTEAGKIIRYMYIHSKSVVVFSLLVARPLQSANMYSSFLSPPLPLSRSSLCFFSSNHSTLEELWEIRLSCVPATKASLCGPAISAKRSVFLFIENLVSCDVVFLRHLLLLENVEHCGGKPEQAANGFGIGFVTNK